MSNRKIYFSETFKKSYKKLVRKNPDVAFDILEKLIKFHLNPFEPSVKSHKLKGFLSEFYAFSVQTDLRIVFRFDDVGNILVVDIGSHDEVY